MDSLPDGVEAYKQTPEFTAASIPRGLLRAHATRAGTWARIVVHAGELDYRILEPVVETHVLSPGNDGIAAPEQRHEVAPRGRVRFHVEFLRAPASSTP